MASCPSPLTSSTPALDLTNHALLAAAACSCVALGAVAGYALARSARERRNATRAVKISDLFVYPIKGCRGVRVSRAKVTPRGLAGDRLLMIVTEEGAMRTQRQLPAMATIRPFWSEAGDLVLTAPNCGDLVLSRDALERDGERRRACVWSHECADAIDMGDATASWLCGALSTLGLRLVRMPSEHGRAVAVGARAHPLSFADGYPFLLASEASREQVRVRAGAPALGMERFRPNIVVSGDLCAFDEHRWHEIALGGALFEAANRCERCQVPRIEQSIGKPDSLPDKQPTTALHEMTGNHFGVNLVLVGNEVSISVGDRVCVREKHAVQRTV